MIVLSVQTYLVAVQQNVAVYLTSPEPKRKLVILSFLHLIL